MVAALKRCPSPPGEWNASFVSFSDSQIRCVAFDKTGTLTKGKPSVVAMLCVEASGWSRDKLLAFTAAAEMHSEHPLGQAIVAYARHCFLFDGAARKETSASGAANSPALTSVTGLVDSRSSVNVPGSGSRIDNTDVHNISNSSHGGVGSSVREGDRDGDKNRDAEWMPLVEQFESLPGLGLHCSIEGRQLIVGNRKLMAMMAIGIPPAVEAFLESAEEQAQTGEGLTQRRNASC